MKEHIKALKELAKVVEIKVHTPSLSKYWIGFMIPLQWAIKELESKETKNE